MSAWRKGTVPDVQLYLSSINYTQSNGTRGAYTISFVREAGRPAAGDEGQ